LVLLIELVELYPYIYWIRPRKVWFGCYVSAKYIQFVKKTTKKAIKELAKPTFCKNFLHALFWSGFVELDELIPNICRIRPENVRLGSYEKGANENSYFFKFLDILSVSRKPKISKMAHFFY
jgi:hypothetical protein